MIKHQLGENAQIAAAWDANVLYRSTELEKGIDTTFRNVTMPLICSALKTHASGKDVLDAGCGLGYLTHGLGALGFSVTGIDISKQSIAFAGARFPHLRFHNSSIQGFSRDNAEAYDVCIASLVLHNLAELSSDLSAIRRMLRKGGTLIGIMLNPDVWFDARKEIAVRIGASNHFHLPFRLNGREPHPMLISYFHRSVDEYVAAMKGAGFRAIALLRCDELSCLPDDLIFLVAR